MEQISGEEFREVFYNHFFSTTVVEKKRIEFMALTQEDMTVAKYHAQFLALERFALGPSKLRDIELPSLLEVLGWVCIP